MMYLVGCWSECFSRTQRAIRTLPFRPERSDTSSDTRSRLQAETYIAGSAECSVPFLLLINCDSWFQLPTTLLIRYCLYQLLFLRMLFRTRS